tara:strand:+ start:124 stop:570 length:447 start_codon:yes stop_codon:yes gene_type:complete
MSTKENYEKKLQTQLDEWGTEIDTLKANADHVSSDRHPQTIATAMHQTLDKLNSLKKDSEPQTSATSSKHLTLDKLQATVASHVKDLQTSVTYLHVAHITALQSMQKSAREKLAELKQADEGTWEDLKPSIERTWKSLGGALRPGHHF